VEDGEVKIYIEPGGGGGTSCEVQEKMTTETYFVQCLCVNEYPANLNDLGGVFGDKDGVLVAGGGNVDDDVAVDAVGDEGGEGGDGRLGSDGLLGSGHV
jgi:hypothetical protein